MNIQPRAIIWAFVAARMAVAPPGGCTVFVRPMMKEAVAQARAPAIHWYESKWGDSWKSLEMQTPIMALKVCPNMALRG